MTFFSAPAAQTQRRRPLSWPSSSLASKSSLTSSTAVRLITLIFLLNYLTYSLICTSELEISDTSQPVITCAVISVANSCTYGSTRVLQALAQSGRAPSIFAKIDKSGRPIYCVALQVAFGFISFITVAADSKTVFNWLLAVTGLSGQFAYASIMIAHIRFRKAWKVQGRSPEDIPWRSALGVVGSYVGVFLVCCSLAATFYSSLFVSRFG